VPNPAISYASRPDATPEAERFALSAVYKFVLSKSNASQKAAEPARKSDGRDDAKEAWLRPGRGVLRG
jgi:hypothetical protein